MWHSLHCTKGLWSLFGKGSPVLSWVDRFVVKSLGMTTKKTISKLHCNSEKTTRGERGSWWGRRERTNHIVSEKECRIMKKRKWAAWCVRERWDTCKGSVWRKSYKKLQRILDTVKTKKEGRMLVQKPRRSDGLYIQNNRKRNFLEEGRCLRLERI